ncbi:MULTISPECIES: methionine--tRNA ligase [Oceanotoga]|uniref:methionine--tRNA ligase n=1 Tax=Oceanotoga TaxID=1255275 RepID=UPI0026560141|nr:MULTISPECIES: methionine--tRNA ligase [Oceanotoga]MDN5342415.1 methionyl-tRNA synthetase [Oceanotoga sp.]MDO7975504.1 methionine--tRNA ligase [Oceanotoga teriensis]
MKKFYVTTPIYYVNSEPHIGSAYTTIVADIIARYKRMNNFDVFFLTGTDEHGQKIMQSAKEKNISPQEWVDKLSNKFKNLWKDMEITNDDFIRTTDKKHEETVKNFVEKLKNKGDIYKGKYEGWYCIPCETFWNEDDIKKKDGKNYCPDCHRELKWVEEENYFFKLSKYNDALLKLYEENPNFVQPDFRRNEMYQILKSGLRDLSITRTTFDWGIPLRDDPEHVIYVWVDALINYISALGYSTDNDDKFKEYWPADLHLIGKEINRFHSIIWPAMLISAELPLPKQIFAHGWLTVNGEKISKSAGNAIEPRLLMDKYSKDAIRYYLLRDIQFGRDGDFSEDNLITRYNADLANDLSNLVHRTLSMTNKYFEGKILKTNSYEDIDKRLHSIIDENCKKYYDLMDNYNFTQALESVWEIIRFSNKYIDLTEPWKLAKDPEKKERLSLVLYNLVDSFRIVSILISPIMPETAEKILFKIGLKNDHLNSKNTKIGILPDIEKVSIGEPIYQRIDIEKWNKVIIMKNKEEEVMEDNVISLIDFEDFSKVDLRVAKILEAEDVKKSKKLLKLQLDLGELGKRQIVAGIKQHYTPEELIGKKIIVVANLKPAKLMGIESNGMLLAAKNSEKLTILTVDRDIEPGLKVS